jgi:hypothetical protein
MAEVPAAAVAPDTMVEAAPAEPAAEEVVATAEAAAPKVAGAPSSGPQPAQEDMPEVVYGRHLLPSPVEIPLPRLLVKAQRALDEVESGFRREWEKLEVERLRLSDWERRLGDRMKTVSSCHAKERAQLKQEHDDLQEQLQKVLEREAAAAQRERAAVRWEAMVIERELAMEERSRVALELTNHAKAALKLIEE